MDRLQKLQAYLDESFDPSVGRDCGDEIVLAETCRKMLQAVLGECAVTRESDSLPYMGERDKAVRIIDAMYGVLEDE